MSKNKTIFDIIGPVMIGPSSSHTAGAARIGLLAGKIFAKTEASEDASLKKAVFTLYNSFAKTGFGHGTREALLAGILGYPEDEPDIKNSFEIANKKGVEFEFHFKDDLNKHPNAVKIEMEDKKGEKVTVDGVSLGAGEISINKINGYKFDLTGEYDTLVLIYKDAPGVVYRVTSLIQSQNVNIASMHCDRNAKGQIASMGIALDNKISDYTMQKLSEINDMYFIRKLEKLS